MRRKLLLLGVGTVVLTAVAAACAPLPPDPPAPYLDVRYSQVTVTPQGAPLTFGVAPPIDPKVGPGDPYGRPLDAAGNEIQRVYVADPTDNTATNRPAVIWVHGGGFKAGIGSSYSLGSTVGRDYAARGYVGFSIEYRIDTTSDCQWVQDNPPTTPGYAEKRAQCERGIIAAQRDTLAAVRWVRRHAADFHIDPNRVAVGGFSAGAVTAVHVATRAEDAGTWAYQPDDDPAANGEPNAAFGASGCSYAPDTVGAGDAPMSFIHSELDQAVPYACMADTAARARAAGVVAELTSYCDQGGHAKALYDANQAVTDAQWTTFLVRELHIYSGTRPASADPFCT